MANLIYSRGFPYGAPLVMVRGGATKVPVIKDFLKRNGFQWNGVRYAWETYMDRSDFGPLLKTLRDYYGANVMPKSDMDTSYLIDLDSPDFNRPNKEV
jgi:hypothetical protein